MWEKLPVLALCGFSGSGKTTLIEQVLPSLIQRGFKVAVLKHDAHGIHVDHTGKDSDRLFNAGADVLLQGPNEGLLRVHEPLSINLEHTLSELSQHYDLVLVEGHKDSPLPKIWLMAENESSPPPETRNIIATLERDSARPEQLLSMLESWLPQKWLTTPVYGCVLIGGKSTRMGRPKHLIERDGKSWLETTMAQLENVVDRVVIVGAGEIPKPLLSYTRLPDIPMVQGPMSGILSAMRWAPTVSWLVAACDMPSITLEALRWLVEKRAPGIWATLPRLTTTSNVEPLLAHYDFRSRQALEEFAERKDYSPSKMVSHKKIDTPLIPSHLTLAWRNINTVVELNQ